MSHTIELIERFKATKGIESDYAAAKALGLNPNRISNYRCGVSHADDRMAVVLADELGLDRLETIARINADRAKDSASRAFWKRVAKQVASAAALVLLVGAAGAPSPAAASEGAKSHAPSLYIMSILLRLLRMARSRPLGLTPLPV